ncbi:MAG: prepilin-type N-terminal cleavage/methylation domain-containing protein [Candidatus Buchananbacteria bacterium]
MLKFPKPTRPGFTLIEVAISIFLVSAIATTILSMFPFILRIGKNSEMNSLATALAQGKIEELSTGDYDSLTTGTLENHVRVSTNPESFFYNYWRTTTINYLDTNLITSASDQGLKKVAVTIYWKIAISLPIEKSLTIQSIIAKK